MKKAIVSPWSRSLQHASGELLLLMAVLGGRRLKKRIDRELDRRARLRITCRRWTTATRPIYAA